MGRATVANLQLPERLTLSRSRNELRAERARKKADEKRVRRVQRDQRRTQMNMAVVSAVMNSYDPSSVHQIVQQTHAALLYGDSVTLVSPVAALGKSARDVSQLNGLELLAELERVAPKYFPHVEAPLLEFRQSMEKFDDLPPRGFWTSTQRREYDGYMAQL